MAEVREALAWTREAFHTADDQQHACPEEIDVTGRMRVIVFGPMTVLPAGAWRMTLRIWLSETAARNPYLFQVIRGDSLVERRFQPTSGGVFNVELVSDYHADTLMAVRLWVARGAFDGRLRFEALKAEPA